MQKPAHVGLIVRSQDSARVDQLLADYAARFRRDFGAVLPPAARPAS